MTGGFSGYQNVYLMICQTLQIWGFFHWTRNGDMPTMAAIRDKIGGSFTTIGPWLKEWKAEQSKAAVPAPEMPDNVVNAMRQAAANIWETASQIASEKVDRIQKDADERIQQAETEAKEYAKEIERLEAQLNEVKKERDTAVESKERVFIKAANLETENASLSAQLTEKEKAFDKLEAKYEKLQNELLDIAKGKA